MNIKEARNKVLQGWEALRPLLDQARTYSDEPWMQQYFPASAEMDGYFYGSLDRFALLLASLSHHCPAGARVLDAGAGYAMQTAALKQAGFHVSAADVYDGLPVYEQLGIAYRRWHLEADMHAPFSDDAFDAVILSQTIEHFTYSPREPIARLLKVIRPGGYLVIDAPNISSFHNVSRLFRGKSIHWSLRRHYLEQQPHVIEGVPYYDRHNHEYAMHDLVELAGYFDLEVCEMGYYSPVNRHQKAAWLIVFSKLRDVVPWWRKGLYAVYRKK